MKLLVLGRDGQVGREAVAQLPALGDVVAYGRDRGDFEHPEMLSALIEAERPDVIVNAAAYTAVDLAEDERDRSWTINAGAVGAIGEAAARTGALVVHYSTDYVFDGQGSGVYDETHPTSPLSVYGASKLAGEVLLRDSGANHLIFRTSWVYAPTGKNFPLTILRLARERDSIAVVADQFGAPTPAKLIVEVTATAIAQALADPGKAGLYHLAAAGEASWHDVARFLVAEARGAGASLKLPPDGIRAIPASEYPTKAVRPANSRLDTSKLRSTFGIVLPPWQDGIVALIKTLQREGRL